MMKKKKLTPEKVLEIAFTRIFIRAKISWNSYQGQNFEVKIPGYKFEATIVLGQSGGLGCEGRYLLVDYEYEEPNCFYHPQNSKVEVWSKPCKIGTIYVYENQMVRGSELKETLKDRIDNGWTDEELKCKDVVILKETDDGGQVVYPSNFLAMPLLQTMFVLVSNELIKQKVEDTLFSQRFIPFRNKQMKNVASLF